MLGCTCTSKISPETYRIETTAYEHFERTLVNSNWLK